MRFLTQAMCFFTYSCQLVRKLKNVPQPMALEMIDQFRCVVLCNRELRIYDLNTGELVSKLKGWYLPILIYSYENDRYSSNQNILQV